MRPLCLPPPNPQVALAATLRPATTTEGGPAACGRRSAWWQRITAAAARLARRRCERAAAPWTRPSQPRCARDCTIPWPAAWAAATSCSSGAGCCGWVGAAVALRSLGRLGARTCIRCCGSAAAVRPPHSLHARSMPNGTAECIDAREVAPAAANETMYAGGWWGSSRQRWLRGLCSASRMALVPGLPPCRASHCCPCLVLPAPRPPRRLPEWRPGGGGAS